MTKRIEGRTPQRRPRAAAPPRGAAIAHPHSIANIDPVADAENAPDQPFAEGARDAIDRDLRHRMVSEAAYRRYVERGYADGYDLEDWLQAEAEVEHLLLNPPEH